MAKKPTLTIVPTKPSPIAPPSSLGEAGAKLWSTIMSEYCIDDAGGAEMLLQICAGADRADEFSQIIARDGAVIRTKAGVRDHPLLKHELATRSFVVRALHRLGLDIEPTRTVAGRPPGTYIPRGKS
jgi:hypothetical protein